MRDAEVRAPARFTSKYASGFTLVELLIVVAIIAILAAIAIPQYNKYTLSSQIANLRSDLKNAYTSAQGYLLEHNGAVVSLEESLTRHGYKRSKTIEFISSDITVGGGTIRLKNSSISASAASTDIGIIDYNGNLTLPNPL